MIVRALQRADWDEWLRLRCALWPEDPRAHEAEMHEWLARADTSVFVAVRPAGGLGGFAEAGTRPYADGCESSPVAFLEGWYVDTDLRRKSVGRRLVEAVETWARERGLTELASDALLENTLSHRAHEHIGFLEVERAVRYRKPL
ncbi:MAG TPA: aminoglycoside 6'-N-acetyltransferase [Thermoanaerobaculia bacterium]|nr:aminoglycoside 6'-N-acetyltransferase [Thermoanaerobaculia bacterium]